MVTSSGRRTILALLMAVICTFLAPCPLIESPTPKSRWQQAQVEQLFTNVRQVIGVHGEPDASFVMGDNNSRILFFANWGRSVHADADGNIRCIKILGP
jgi:hypothetical protein